MRSKANYLFLVCVGAWNISHSTAFQVSVPNQQQLANRVSQLRLATENVADDTVLEENTNGDAKLTFRGEISVSSESLPMVSKEKLDSFFRATENRNLLLTAGGKRSCEDSSITSELLEQWKKACDGVGAQTPDENDAVIQVQTGGVDFPGLQVISLAKIGLKLVDNPSDSSAKYEVVLIGDQRTVKGLPPVVWIFNKLTGAGGKNEEKKDLSTKTFTNVSYKIISNTVVFKSDVSLAITVKFPAVLLSILPTSKQKAEETGGKAITKTVEKDVYDAMEAFEAAYLKWIDTGI